MFGSSRNEYRPVEVVFVHNGHTAVFVCGFDKFDPLRIIAFEIGGNVLVIIDSTETEIEGARLVFSIISASFHALASGKVGKVGVSGAIDEAFAEDDLSAALAFNNDGADFIVGHDSINDDGVEQYIDTALFDHAVEDKFVFFRIGVAAGMTVNFFKTGKHFLADSGGNVKRNGNQSDGGETSEGSRLVDDEYFCAVARCGDR